MWALWLLGFAALAPAKPTHSRRHVTIATAAAATANLVPATLNHALAAAFDDDDDDDDDELAGLLGSASGVKKRTKPAEKGAARKVSATDVKQAVASLRTARAELRAIEASLARGESVSSASLGSGALGSAKGSLLALVQGPGLDADAKLQIGNEKRFGLGADVLIMVGGLVESGGVGRSALDFATKAGAALDEVLALCREI